MLQQVARKVEQRIPLLMYKTKDDIQQLKRFIQVYYGPILSKLDHEQLNEALRSKYVSSSEDNERNKSTKKEKHIKRQSLE